jgi:hypothetical protein
MSKTSAKPATTAKPATAGNGDKASVASALVVLGYVEGKPCGARFTGIDPGLVGKAAAAMDLKVYPVTTAEVADVAKKLPVGRLYGNGRAFVPNIRQDLYSKLLGPIAADPSQAPPGSPAAIPDVPVAIGLPRSWDEIARGHLVIAQETLENGWWEAIVLARTGDMFTLRFRDYPQLPKFVRHRNAIALMSPPAE